MLQNFKNTISNLLSLSGSKKEPTGQNGRQAKRMQVKKLRKTIPKVNLKAFQNALNIAMREENPNRKDLYNLYDEAIKDCHLLSQILLAKNTQTFAPFTSDSQDLIDLFQQSWFVDFVESAIDAEIYGHTLVQIRFVDGKIDFSKVSRNHVVPETSEIISNFEDEENRSCYKDVKDAWGFIELGKGNFGLMEIAIKEIIAKGNASIEWDRLAKDYNIPWVSILTGADNDEELDNIEEAAANFGVENYYIGDKEDKVDVISPLSNVNHSIYLERIKFIEASLSKLINGQDASSNEKSFVGAAEVQERILNIYTLARLRRIKNVIIEELIPLLVRIGALKSEVKFDYVELQELQKKPTEVKKKSKQQIKLTYLSDDFADEEESEEEPEFEGIAFSFFSAAMKSLYNIFKKDKKPSNKDYFKAGKDLTVETSQKLQNAVNLGFSQIEYKPSKALTKNISDQVHLFSECKTHKSLKEATNLLLNDKGEIKPWNKFRDDILDVHNEYNVNYLRTEYDLAVGNSHTAAQWEFFESQGDDFYLKYKVLDRDKSRKSHKALDGITLPITHDFWKKYYPKNGFGCRCFAILVNKSSHKITKTIEWDGKNVSVEKMGEIATTEIDKKGNNKAEMFRFNPGITKTIFPKHHPYFEHQKKSA